MFSVCSYFKTPLASNLDITKKYEQIPLADFTRKEGVCTFNCTVFTFACNYSLGSLAEG